LLPVVPLSGLDFADETVDNAFMVIKGRVRNGVVVLENGSALPEGAEVAVSYPAPIPAAPTAERKRVEFPLVRSSQPGSVLLTNERIGEILDEEDAAPRC
jgi:hypothetical protein